MDHNPFKNASMYKQVLHTMFPHRHKKDDNAPCVLVYGRDAFLLETRAKVIRTGGFRTCEASTYSELLERLKPGRCKAVVLCHTLSDDQAGGASQLAKRKIPDIKIIAMAPYSAAFDETLGRFAGPNELLAALSRTLP